MYAIRTNSTDDENYRRRAIVVIITAVIAVTISIVVGGLRTARRRISVDDVDILFVAALWIRTDFNAFFR